MNDDEKRRKMRETIAQKNMSDERLRNIIWDCAHHGWVEELTLTVNVPRSSVKCFNILIVCCLNNVEYYDEFLVAFLFCAKYMR